MEVSTAELPSWARAVKQERRNVRWGAGWSRGLELQGCCCCRICATSTCPAYSTKLLNFQQRTFFTDASTHFAGDISGSEA